jgi:hypothetical protein
MLGERRPEGADENEYQCFETMAWKKENPTIRYGKWIPNQQKSSGFLSLSFTHGNELPFSISRQENADYFKDLNVPKYHFKDPY